VTTDIAQERQQVHELIDRLAPSQVIAARGMIEALLENGLEHGLESEDEEITSETAAQLDRASIHRSRRGHSAR
jgi:hypothetical protein